MPKLLETENLTMNFYTYEGVVHALDRINLNIREGEILGLVGETGCGKSVTALSILRLIRPPGRIEGGKVNFRLKDRFAASKRDINLLDQDEAFMQKIRGNEISMIFQEPSTALNPVYSIRDQISESFLLHRKKELCQAALDKIEQDIKKDVSFLKRAILKMERGIYLKMIKNPSSFLLIFLSFIPGVRRYNRRVLEEAKRRSIEMLRILGIAHPEGVVMRYPHELSGGMQQRVVIAMALACNPTLLIADEPTSNLDVTIQAQILDLVRKLRQEFGSSILFITHDLGVVAEICERVVVMYAGHIAEVAPVRSLFKRPLHPYTQGLLKSVPRPGQKDRLQSIKGSVPNLISPPSGCRFHPRCPSVMPRCSGAKPSLKEIEKSRLVACYLYHQEENKDDT
ncbi:MAG: ABC transporter ATP-binding protein [Candidatus Aerophobetes bacterium]